MSLTFDFPEWRLSTNNNQKRNGVASGDARNPSGAGPANGDWAADLDDLDSDNEGAAAGAGADVRSADGAGTHLGGLDGGGSTGAADAAAVSGCCEVADDVSGGAAASAPRVRISGDAIPAEVLLLVLSGLRDTADCVRAAAVCRHWMSVVALSNELWFEMQARDWGLGGAGSRSSGSAGGHSAAPVAGGGGGSTSGGGGGGVCGGGGGGGAPGGTWHRAPYAGRPLLLPPPGAGHMRSLMLQYKTTCALTQVAVRFMVLRKGFEYLVEAAASLWLAAQRAAAAAAAAVPTEAGIADNQQPQGSSDGGAGVGSATPPAKPVEAGPLIGACGSSGGGGSSAGVGGGSSGGGKRRRITHVDQLWEGCGSGSRAALQVDERFNAVKVQQMAGKLIVGSSSGSSSCGAGGGNIGSSSAGGGGGGSSATANWLLLYEGVSAVMVSRCDEVRDELATEAAADAARAAAAAAATTTTTAAAADVPVTDAGSCRGVGSAAAARAGAGRGGAGAAGGCGGMVLRGEVVYGGSSYADRFAELLRRGDTRGALALGAQERAAAAAARRRQATGQGDGAGGGGSGGGDGRGCDAVNVVEAEAAAEAAEEEEAAGELEEEEMREVVESAGDEAAATSPPPAVVAEGLLLWRRLLRCWAVYRRWLECTF